MSEPVNYKRIVPEYQDEDGTKYIALIETKESCITDDVGVRLDHKLNKLDETLKSLNANVHTICDNIINEKTETTHKQIFNAIEGLQSQIDELRESIQNISV